MNLEALRKVKIARILIDSLIISSFDKKTEEKVLEFLWKLIEEHYEENNEILLDFLNFTFYFMSKSSFFEKKLKYLHIYEAQINEYQLEYLQQEIFLLFNRFLMTSRNLFFIKPALIASYIKIRGEYLQNNDFFEKFSQKTTFFNIEKLMISAFIMSIMMNNDGEEELYIRYIKFFINSNVIYNFGVYCWVKTNSFIENFKKFTEKPLFNTEKSPVSIEKPPANSEKSPANPEKPSARLENHDKTDDFLAFLEKYIQIDEKTTVLTSNKPSDKSKLSFFLCCIIQSLENIFVCIEKIMEKDMIFRFYEEKSSFFDKIAQEISFIPKSPLKSPPIQAIKISIEAKNNPLFEIFSEKPKKIEFSSENREIMKIYLIKEIFTSEIENQAKKHDFLNFLNKNEVFMSNIPNLPIISKSLAIVLCITENMTFSDNEIEGILSKILDIYSLLYKTMDILILKDDIIKRNIEKIIEIIRKQVECLVRGRDKLLEMIKGKFTEDDYISLEMKIIEGLIDVNNGEELENAVNFKNFANILIFSYSFF